MEKVKTKLRWWLHTEVWLRSVFMTFSWFRIKVKRIAIKSTRITSYLLYSLRSHPSSIVKHPNIFRKYIVVLLFAFECKNVIVFRRGFLHDIWVLCTVYILKFSNIPQKTELADFLSSFHTRDRKKKEALVWFNILQRFPERYLFKKSRPN
jgi:hypothetical protein